MISIRELCVTKGDRRICSVPELTVESGTRLAVLGANGCGKTTLLRVLAGLENDYQGHRHVAAHRSELVYVHQLPFLFHGSILFNVTYGLSGRTRKRADRNRLAHQWLERFGMADRAGDSVACLSGGERKRVALARAFILRPRLLLLDEPLAEMDSDGVDCLRAAIAELQHTTVLIASPYVLPDGIAEAVFSFGVDGSE